MVCNVCLRSECICDDVGVRISETSDSHDALKRERRYALLQAAAMIFAGYSASGHDDHSHEACVEHAELLLSEIMSREKASQ